MRIVCNGHSCFTLITSAGTLVTDPYRDGSVPGFPPLALSADAVFCSHGHADHCATEAVTLTGNPCAVEVEEISTYHDPEKGALRGPNTIRVFSAEGLRVAHLGDLGCDLTAQQKQRLAGLDALLIPVGGYYTIDAAAAWALAKELDPRVILPMHFRSVGRGYDVTAPLSDFLALCDRPVIRHGNAMELNANTPRQVAVLEL